MGLRINKPIVPRAAFRTTRQQVARVARTFREGEKEQITVGLPSNSTPYPDGTSVVLVGFWNEFGTTDGRIPERPWLRTAAAENSDAWVALAQQATALAVKRNRAMNQVLRIVGEKMQFDVQAKLDSGPWEPNAEPYASIKAAQGKTKPLIVTGHLRGSIRWAIVPARTQVLSSGQIPTGIAQ